MRKLVLVGCLLCLLLVSKAFAGSPFDNSNGDSKIYGGANYAWIHAGPHLNMAGLGFWEPGIYVTAGSQWVIKDYYTKMKAPWGKMKFESTKDSIVPNFNIVYGPERFPNLKLFALAEVEFGGGAVDYNGSVKTELISNQIAFQTSMALPGSRYVQEHSVKANHVGWSFGGGFAIKLDRLSLAFMLSHIRAKFDVEVDAELTDANGLYPDMPHDIAFKYEDTAWRPLVGAHYRILDNLDAAITLKGPAKISYEADIDKDTPGVLDSLDVVDGKSKRGDLPASAHFGLYWGVTKKLDLGFDLDYYFNNDFGVKLGATRLTEDLEKEVRDAYEMTVGWRYKFNPYFSIHSKYTYSYQGIDVEHSSTFKPDLNAHTVGGGLTYNYKKFVADLNLAHVWYETDEFTMQTPAGPADIEYGKDVWAVAFEGKIKF